MQNNQTAIDSVLEKADIVSIISAYLSLNKKGANYWGICPFHPDSHPSMSVSPQKRIFNCFTCKAGGNVINFVKMFENISFDQALHKVAEISGIEIKQNYSPSKREKLEQRIWAINERVSSFFASNLSIKNDEINQVNNYLQSRHLSQKEIQKFEIGWAPNTDQIINLLLTDGFSISEIQASGLVGINDDATMFTYFKNRLMFPIRNEENHIIGFSGRTIDANEKTKYINTKETQVFKKSELAYNIQRIQNEIRISKELIILEGFMDVISLERIGITNSIALMGTALSGYHINLFKRFKTKVKLFLDNDNPGVDATIKATIKLLKGNIPVQVVNIDSILDPDEMINQGQEDKLKTALESAIHPVDFVVEKLIKRINLNDPNSYKIIMSQIENWLREINDTFITNRAIELLNKHNYTISVTNTKSATISKIEDKPNSIRNYSYENKLHRADCSIFMSLLREERYIDKIKLHKNIMNDLDLKNAVDNLIIQYEKHNYSGNDIEYALKLIESTNYIGFEEKAKQLIEDHLFQAIEITDKMLDDAFDVLQQNELEKISKHLNNQIANESSIEQRKILLEHLAKNKNKIANLVSNKRKGRKND